MKIFNYELAKDWLTNDEVDSVRRDVKERYGVPEINWEENHVLEKLLAMDEEDKNNGPAV